MATSTESKTPDATSQASKPAKGGKKKQTQFQSEILWTVRVEQAWNYFRSQVAEIVRGIWSPDVPTRRFALVFILSFTTVFVVIGAAVVRYWELTHSEER